MTRAENMTRLWRDPAFRQRRKDQASAHMTTLNAKQWKDPKFVARSTARLLAATRKDDCPPDNVPHETTSV